ncbi:aldo/keto reductase [Streptomyces sp. NPDC006923]|uniref:aldo/keto reductase n=1 Tax=Streptomyces sp. NPDC006923 TaxID=3155355 RepID=UPI003409AE09
MKFNRLGNTGLLVSQLCFGTMTFSGSGGVYQHIGNVGQAGADELVKAAVDAGINFFDTADVYSAGQSEEILGQSFRNLGIARHEYVLATKVYSRMGPGPNDVGASRGHIMNAVEASLRRLQTDYLDLYHVHATDTLTPVEETLRALDDLVRQGKVRYVGVSNWHAWRIAKALGIQARSGYAPLSTVQAYYSVAGRDVEREIVPLLAEEGLGLLVWSPLAGGLLSGKFSRDNQNPEGSRRSGFDFPVVDKERAWKVIDVLGPIAEAHGCSPARIALAWLLARPAVTSVLVGAKRLDQLRDNVAAVDVVLTHEETRQLDEVSQLPPEYPGWMVETQGADRWGAVDLWETHVAQS